MDKDISFLGLVERFLHTIFIGRRKMNVIFNFVENLLSLISHACDNRKDPSGVAGFHKSL